MLADIDPSTLGIPHYMQETEDDNPNEIKLDDEEVLDL